MKHRHAIRQQIATPSAVLVTSAIGYILIPYGYKLFAVDKNLIGGRILELELELIQTQMTQKPMLRAEVGMRVRCANKASGE